MKSTFAKLLIGLITMATAQMTVAHPTDDLSYLHLGKGTKFKLAKALNFPAMSTSASLGKIVKGANTKHCLVHLISLTAIEKNYQSDLEIPAGQRLTILKVTMDKYPHSHAPMQPSASNDKGAFDGEVLLRTESGTVLKLFCGEIGPDIYRQLSIGEVKSVIKDNAKIELASPIKIDYDDAPVFEESEYQDI